MIAQGTVPHSLFSFSAGSWEKDWLVAGGARGGGVARCVVVIVHRRKRAR